MADLYTSQFSGDELDYAISRALGNKYRGDNTPGCHLVGDDEDFAVDLNFLSLPGKYTMMYYIHGPEFINGSVSPIFVKVFWSGQMLYQTIMIGATLYWRDLNSGELTWKKIDMGVEQTPILNYLDYDKNGTKSSLSQRMGTHLKTMIDNLQIGNANLLDFSNGIFGYANIEDGEENELPYYWNIYKSGTNANAYIKNVVYDYDIDFESFMPDRDYGSDIASKTSKKLSKLISDNNLQLEKFPMFDDLDMGIITIFGVNGASGTSCAFTTYASDTDSKTRTNPIHAAHASRYTASVYLICSPLFLTYEASAKAYLKLYSTSNPTEVIASTEIQLNRLGSVDTADESGVMQKPYCFNILEQENEDTHGYGIPYIIPEDDIRLGKDYIGYYRLTVTLDNTKGISGFEGLRMQFGINNGSGMFLYPKVEYGDYATQYNHSWGDLYYFFNNCEQIFGVTIDALGPSSFNEQDGIVYDSTRKMFNHEPVAVGGGGGFVVLENEAAASSHPRKDKILVYDYSKRKLIFWDTQHSKFASAVNKPMVLMGSEDGQPTYIASPDPNDYANYIDCESGQGWLDKSLSDDNTPAVLKYYDTDRRCWRPVGAYNVLGVFIVAEEPPASVDDRKKIWIKESTSAPYYYHNNAWRPMLAVWGGT